MGSGKAWVWRTASGWNQKACAFPSCWSSWWTADTRRVGLPLSVTAVGRRSHSVCARGVGMAIAMLGRGLDTPARLRW